MILDEHLKPPEHIAQELVHTHRRQLEAQAAALKLDRKLQKKKQEEEIEAARAFRRTSINAINAKKDAAKAKAALEKARKVSLKMKVAASFKDGLARKNSRDKTVKLAASKFKGLLQARKLRTQASRIKKMTKANEKLKAIRARLKGKKKGKSVKGAKYGKAAASADKKGKKPSVIVKQSLNRGMGGAKGRPKPAAPPPDKEALTIKNEERGIIKKQLVVVDAFKSTLKNARDRKVAVGKYTAGLMQRRKMRAKDEKVAKLEADMEKQARANKEQACAWVK